MSVVISILCIAIAWLLCQLVNGVPDVWLKIWGGPGWLLGGGVIALFAWLLKDP